MDGFKDHFSYLFNNTLDNQSDDEGSNQTITLYLASNDTSLDFCGSPDHAASIDSLKSCGSGEGADSASVIVSNCNCYNLYVQKVLRTFTPTNVSIACTSE